MAGVFSPSINNDDPCRTDPLCRTSSSEMSVDSEGNVKDTVRGPLRPNRPWPWCNFPSDSESDGCILGFSDLMPVSFLASLSVQLFYPCNLVGSFLNLFCCFDRLLCNLMHTLIYLKLVTKEGRGLVEIMLVS